MAGDGIDQLWPLLNGSGYSKMITQLGEKDIQHPALGVFFFTLLFQLGIQELSNHLLNSC